MGRLSTINLLLALGGYGIFFYGYAMTKHAQIGFSEMWLPSQRDTIIGTLQFARASDSKSSNPPPKKKTKTKPSKNLLNPFGPLAVG